MIETLSVYIKLAVDIWRAILAGDGEFHADCKTVLLEDGTQQIDIWEADWYLDSQTVTYQSLINIYARQNN